MSNVHQLYRLQTIDTTIQDGKTRLSQILQAQKEPQDLLDARQKKQTLSDEARKLQTASREKELEIGSVNAKIKGNNDRLYSGKERNPKALQDLQQELVFLNRHRGELEDTLLETMVSLEEVEELLSEASGRLEKLEKDWAGTLTRLQAEQLETATNLNEQLALRQTAAAQLDPASLQTYETLLKNKRGLAVALVQDNTCQGCRVSLTNNVLRALHHGELIHCSMCGRILYSKE